MNGGQDPQGSQETVIAIVLFEGMTTLDAVGPVEVLRFLPGARIELVAAGPGPVRTDTPSLELVATSAFGDVVRPDVVVVPGGPGVADVLDGELVEWLRASHPGARWTTSVCSGSVVLAAVGLLDGVQATSHFSVLDLLAGFGAIPTARRVLVDRCRRLITSAGVSSGIDMALTLAADLADELTARAIQLVIEYDPQPPYNSGSLNSASPQVVARAVAIGRPHGAIPAFWIPPPSTPTHVNEATP
jgi:transcriptional regulator GlxA family with amidase domain